MKSAVLLAAGAALVLFAGHLPAVAAGVPTDAKPVVADAQAMRAADQTGMQGVGIRQQIENQLTSNGFTNVQITPSSFLVRARDKAGNPVEMVIGPDSVTTVTEVAPAPASTKPGTTAPTAPAAPSKG